MSDERHVATLALVPAVVDAVHPMPVLAAGGIADGRGLAAVLALGATAGWVGTAFLLAAELLAHFDYQVAVAAASATGTVHGVVFDGGWPHARAGRCATAPWRRGRPPVDPDGGHRPGEDDVLAINATGQRLLGYGDALPPAAIDGDVEPMALYAGQGVDLLQDVRPAADVTRDLAAAARQVLIRLTLNHWLGIRCRSFVLPHEDPYVPAGLPATCSAPAVRTGTCVAVGTPPRA